MMVIETRESAKDKAFDLVEKIEDLDHKKKLALCELEDVLYEYFESEDDDHKEDKESEMSYRMRRGYRSRRSSMRDHSDYEDDYEMEDPKNYRRAMRIHR